MNTVSIEDMRNDLDWISAFHEAEFGFCGCPIHGTGTILEKVVEVIAADAGENDGEDWIALVRLSDGRFAKMFAGCDYTGWDCQAGGSIEFYATREGLMSTLTLLPYEAHRLGIKLDHPQ